MRVYGKLRKFQFQDGAVKSVNGGADSVFAYLFQFQDGAVKSGERIEILF